MISLHAPKPQRPHVMALFQDGVDAFRLPLGSTFTELANRIDGLGARHSGDPIAIQIHFERPTLSPVTEPLRHRRTSTQTINRG